MKYYEIKLTPELFATLIEADKTEILEFDKTELVEIVWDMIEELDLQNDENIINTLIDFLAIEKTYLESWEEWILPELHDRLKNNKKVDYKKVLLALDYITPGRNRDSLLDILDYWYRDIFNYSSIYNIPKEEIEYIEENYDLPDEWEEAFKFDHFIDELEKFEDFKFISEYVDKEWSELTGNKRVKEVLINLAESGKYKNNFELFLDIINDTKPARDTFRPYHKEYISTIINSCYDLNEDQFEIITDKFYDIDFDIPYLDIIRESVRAEIEHVERMTKINPQYRHD